ncbi:MAG: hypothetical protein KIT57_04995 [Blastocatellales bacterium]|nr:hypothetical protein [Blastocatellales bacterium]
MERLDPDTADDRRNVQIAFGDSRYGKRRSSVSADRDQGRNGNFISVAYRSLENTDRVIDYIIDTAGRRIDFYYQSNRLLEIRQNRNGVWYKYVELLCAGEIMQPLFLSTTVDPADDQRAAGLSAGANHLPEGQNFRFHYTNFGQMYDRKWARPLPGRGAERRIAYTHFHLNPNETMPQSDCPRFGARSEQAENWQGGYGTSYQYYGGHIIAPHGYWYVVSTNGLTQQILS